MLSASITIRETHRHRWWPSSTWPMASAVRSASATTTAAASNYNRPALKALRLKREAVKEMVEALREPVTKEVMDVVSQCLGD